MQSVSDEEPVWCLRYQLRGQIRAKRCCICNWPAQRTGDALRAIGPQNLTPQPDLITLNHRKPCNRCFTRPVQLQQKRPLRRQPLPSGCVMNARQQRFYPGIRNPPLNANCPLRHRWQHFIHLNRPTRHMRHP